MDEKELLKYVIEENLLNKETIRQRVLFAAHTQTNKTFNKKGICYIMKRKSVLIPVSLCLAFAIMLNTSSAFALSVANIPILGAIAKVITIREYTHSSDSDKTHVKIPNIANTGNSELEKRINTEISQKIQELADKAQADAAEYKRCYLSMGNQESEYLPISYNFDYEVTCSNENTLCFVVTQTETNNTSQRYNDEMHVPEKAEYTTHYMYNIDLKTGKDITLKDLLGDNYKQIADREVERQVKERAKANKNLFYYYEQYYATKGNCGIDDTQQFYINKTGNPVLVFEKYEIAPEYAGVQEFEIQK